MLNAVNFFSLDSRISVWVRIDLTFEFSKGTEKIHVWHYEKHIGLHTLLAEFVHTSLSKRQFNNA